MNQKGFLQLILVIIIGTVVVIAGGGFWYYQQSAEQNKSAPAPQPTEQSKQQAPTIAAPAAQTPPIKATPKPYSAVDKQSSDESMQSSQRDSTDSANCQPNARPIFTASFTDIDKLARISPMGGIMVGSQSRSYVGMKKDGNDFSTPSPVYAPVDSKLVGIVYAWRGDKAAGVAEYRLDFQVSCEVTYSFDHIPQLSDKLSKLAPEKPADSTRDNPITPVPVAVGEQVGSTRKGLDFFLFNRAKKVEHINPKR